MNIVNALNSAAHTMWGCVASTRVRAVLSLGMVLGLSAMGTLASWTDNATATSGPFVIGTIDLKAGGADNYTFTALNMANMRPGNSRAALLSVTNAGSLPLTYDANVKYSSTNVPAANSVGPQLRLSIFPGGTATNSPSGAPKTGSCGTVGRLGAITTPTLTGASIFSGRALAPVPAADSLCVLVTLPAGTAETPADTSATLTLSFIGQVA